MNIKEKNEIVTQLQRLGYNRDNDNPFEIQDCYFNKGNTFEGYFLLIKRVTIPCEEDCNHMEGDEECSQVVDLTPIEVFEIISKDLINKKAKSAAETERLQQIISLLKGLDSVIKEDGK